MGSGDLIVSSTNIYQDYPIHRKSVMTIGNSGYGFTLSESGTATAVTVPSQGLIYRQYRTAQTAGSSAGIVEGNYNWLPTYSVIPCGFYFQFRVRINEADSLTRFIFGLGRANNTPGNTEPSTNIGVHLWFGADSTDTNLFLYSKPITGTGVVRYNTGFPKVNSHVYLGTFNRITGGISTVCTLKNLTTGVTFSQTLNYSNDSNSGAPFFFVNNATSPIFASIQVQRIELLTSD